MSLSDYLAPKQLEVLHSYLNDDFGMMILTGAVRSGKTFIDNLLFIYELRRTARLAKEHGDKHPQYILAGASSDSINKNVIISCMNQFGVEFKLDRHGHYHLFGVDITPVSTATMAGLKGARGFTAYGGYVNEATLGVEPVFQEILQRCSMPGSHIIVDTNPDNPQHWLKVDYIDKEDKKMKKFVYHFTIDDNTHLAPDYVERIKASTPSGMYYDRAIKGLWVTGEGAIYRDFNERKMVVDGAPKKLKYYAGVDWGYNHPCSITVFGIDEFGRYYLVDEYTERFKEIDYWTNVAKKLQQKYGYNMPFYCDTATPAYIQHFKNAGINALNGWKQVVPGIEIVASLMKQGRFFVWKNHTQKFMEEVYNYQWDDKAEDKPVKEMDHVMDSMRYALATPIHLEELKKQHQTNSRNNIKAGLKRFGL
ncbi:PBSX family phage terminase large subunit [Limosilactobacillus portuensis]|uniref:PBSX family phage terminase large subunit n=1 Tax=Limosilactobacillus portuensis TaxID=2742601 RepID=UPI0023580C41|nr:PBSX family phage terminase large subunit [Limosilactobacillus portuensis]WCT60196.1 PBSX family phage terminase large subunit [Limosilactobacillus portuensis]